MEVRGRLLNVDSLRKGWKLTEEGKEYLIVATLNANCRMTVSVRVVYINICECVCVRLCLAKLMRNALTIE